jgi:ABC-type antimicrobial peptide transport system permease subunit
MPNDTRIASRGWRQLREAMRLVKRRPGRSALASLGVAVAVASLLVAVCMAERARQSTMDEIRRMGADVLVVDAVDTRNVAGRARSGTTVTTLREDDAREIARRVPGIAIVSAEYRGTLPLKVGDLARQVTVSGDGAAYAELRDAGVDRGRFFTAVDETAAQRVAVLGARIARDLFETPDVVGAPIRVGGVPFVVIGVLPERGTGTDAFDEDGVVFVPLRTATRRLFNVEHVHRIFVRVGAGTSLDDARAGIVALLAQRHPRRAGDSVDFRVQDQRRLVTMREGAADRLRTFQIAVAAVLLVAGGSGVFALQLLATRERRAEIGTRRALGATPWEVFSQFVSEAAVVAVAGPLVGVGAGWVGARAVEVPLRPALAVLAASASLITCSAAAALPAFRVARLPAAVALRLR